MLKLLVFKLKNSTLYLITVSVIVWIMYSNCPYYIGKVIETEIGEPATVEKVTFSLDQTEVYNLSIDNIPGSSLPKAFTVKEIEINTSTYNFLKPDIEIKEIILRDVAVYVEFYSMSQNDTNWTLLLKTLNEPKEWYRHLRKTVKIDQCRLENIRVIIQAKGRPVKELPMIKYINLTNLQPENGYLIDRILRIITNHILAEVSIIYKLGGISNIVLTGPKAVFQAITLPFSGLFNKKDKTENSK